MTDRLRSFRLTPADTIALAGAPGFSHLSPFGPFAGSEERAPSFPSSLENLGDEERRAVEVLRHATGRVRAVVPGPTQTLVQHYYTNGVHDQGLVGCWLDGDDFVVSGTWRSSDVATLTSGPILETPPAEVAIEPISVTEDALVALMAVIDATRARLFESLLQRDASLPYRFSLGDVESALAGGMDGEDARWVVTLCNVAGLMPGDVSGVVERGFRELVDAELIHGDDDAWTPGPTVLALASWWRNPLPAVGYEVVRMSGDAIAAIAQRLVVRGDGPLCIVDRHLPDAGGPSVTISTPRAASVVGDLAAWLDQGIGESGQWVYVEAPQAVHGLGDPASVVGFVQPGVWYEVLRSDGEWTHVSDPDGPVEGWVPTGALIPERSRSESRSRDDVSQPAAPWTPTHTVPDPGLRAWVAPDPAAQVAADLEPGVRLELVEQRGAWGHVRAENGWEAWLDARALVVRRSRPEPHASPGSQSSAPTPPAENVQADERGDKLLWVAAAAMLLSTLLPWVDGERNALEVSWKYLFGGQPFDGGVSIGMLVILLAVAAAGMIVMPELRRFRLTTGVIAVVVAIAVLIHVFVESMDWYRGDPMLALGSLFTDHAAPGPVVLAAAGVVLILKR